MSSTDSTPATSDSASANTASQLQNSKWLIVLALVPCVASCYFAMVESPQPPLTVTKSRPSLHFATYMFHHGDQPVKPGARLTSEFRFRNRGTKPITIDRIERSCGCMSPQLTKNTVAPGEVASLIVPLQTVNQSPGFHEYMITLHYADPEPRFTTLTIKATFPEKMLLVQPKALYLSQRSDKALPFQVALSDFRDSPLRVTAVESTASFVTAKIRQKTTSNIVQASFTEEEDAGSHTEILGEVEGNIPAGRHHVLIAATTDDPKFPIITVPMSINGPAFAPGAKAALNVSHLQLDASDDSTARREGHVLLTAPESWKISHATAWPEELEVRYESVGQPQDSQQIIRIHVKLADLPKNRTTDGLVQLIANDGKDLVTVKLTLDWPQSQ